MADTGESRLTATLADIDVATLMRALDVEYIAATRINARIEASWPSLQYEKATGEAKATLTPTRNAASRSVIPVAGTIHATGDGGRIRAQLIRVRAAGAELNGRVAIADQQQLSGAVDARVVDVGGTIAAAERFLGRASGSLAPVPVSGAIQANVRLGGTARAPAIDGNISADALSVGAANGITLRGTVGYMPSAVRVERLDLTWQEARASASGRVELAGARRLNLELSATDLDVPELLKAFNQTAVPGQRYAVAAGERCRYCVTADRVDHDPR